MRTVAQEMYSLETSSNSILARLWLDVTVQHLKDCLNVKLKGED